MNYRNTKDSFRGDGRLGFMGNSKQHIDKTPSDNYQFSASDKGFFPTVPQYSSFDEKHLSLHPWKGKAIILMDLDAFFASVEQLDHPEWRGKPVIVGGSPEKRGVVSTASYEARKYGVHSAMPSSTAARLCSDAIWTSGHFHRYREMSKQVMNILYDESPKLMQVSIDEAFLDITPTRTNTTHPVIIAHRIQNRVSKLGITCSIGLGASKSVAKIASNQNKPKGLTIVYPEQSEQFLATLPIKEMSGIGPVAEKKLRHYRIQTLGDLANADIALLHEVFGKNAQIMKDRALGIDSEVSTEHEPAKSVSNEISFSTSLTEKNDIEARIATMAHKVGRRLRQKQIEGTTLHLKIRREDLTIRTCQRKIPNLGTNELTWLPSLYNMLEEIWTPGEKLRLVGVGISGFDNEPIQTSLFDSTFLAIENDTHDSHTANQLSGSKRNNNAPVQKTSALVHHAERNTKLLEANDLIAKRFGENAVRFGHELKTYADTTGSSAKNPEDYKDY